MSLGSAFVFPPGAHMPAVFSPRRLRDSRLAAGLSPEHVAIATGRSSFSVREYERGRVVPPTQILGPLAAAVGCQVADLFAEEAGDAL
jgi:transcriptional regulator with XRE-family HTH domain